MAEVRGRRPSIREAGGLRGRGRAAVEAMRYNERELLSLSRQPAEKAAEVLMRAPKKGSGKEKGQ